MRTLLATPLVVAGLLLAPLPATAGGSTSPITGATFPQADPTPTTVYLDSVPVTGWTPANQQVITVNHTSGTRARVTSWRYLDGVWYPRAVTSYGRIGYGGLIDGEQRQQGTGTTPLGTYDVPLTFGSITKRSYWDLPYKKFDSDDYWVQDNESAYYNRYRDRDSGGFRYWLDSDNVDSSERLAGYASQYEMAIVIGFNYAEQIRYRGAGIFLHVNGAGATAGCVSVPRWFMVDSMKRLRPDLKPLIAIGY